MEIKVKVITNAKNEKIEKGDVWKVWIKEKPIEGKANKRLIEVLANILGVKKSRIKIVKGIKSREKVVEILEE